MTNTHITTAIVLLCLLSAPALAESPPYIPFPPPPGPGPSGAPLPGLAVTILGQAALLGGVCWAWIKRKARQDV